MRFLVYAAGGGGDIATAAAYALKLRREGHDSYISCAPWERVVIDHVPGPIRFNDIRNAVDKGEYYVVIDSSSYAIRDGNKIVFQAVNVSRALSEQIYLCDMNTGVSGVYNFMKELVEDLKIDVVVGIDVGGDILAEGYEEDLWSPLADQVSLASLFRLSKDGVSSFTAVASPGADGELGRDYVLSRINLVMKMGGLKESQGFGYIDLPIIKNIFDYVQSEAGRVVLDALEGFVGEKKIRNGTRSVYIDAFSTLIFILDTEIVYKLSGTAEKLLYTSSIDEANSILISLGIPTEYELEKEVSRLLSDEGELSRDIIVRARNSLLKRLRG